MSAVLSKREAVMLAREQLGEVSAQVMATHIELTFGVKIEPTIVTVLLGSIREREYLEASKRKTQEEIDRVRAEKLAREMKPRRQKAHKDMSGSS